MKRVAILAVALVLAIVTTVPLNAADAGAAVPRAPMFPKVSLVPLSGGEPVPITSYRGHPVLVNFWATWCPPCRAELPELQQLYTKYGPRGLKVAAVNVNRSSSGVAEFLKQHRLTLPVFRMDEATLRRLGVGSIPMSVLIDATGRVVRVYRGYSPTMVRDIEARLAGMIPAKGHGTDS
ncbi:MAG: TlpA family protein disulfide reductase [Acidobacteria bacterium]|nr:TlpA family protein disulfide reductase [Acidobacteriota bacterium]